MTVQLRQHGFSLVELMVAMLIGLFLTGGIVYVYIGSKTSYNFNVAAANIQENGRFAIHFLTRDIRQAGYKSCVSNAGQVRNTLKDGADGYFWEFDASIQGTNNRDANWASKDVSDALGSRVPTAGTDTITVRFASGTPVPLETSMSSGSSAIDVNSNNDFGSNDILLITDCADAVIFQVTGITSGSDDLEHIVGGTLTSSDPNGPKPGNETGDLNKNFDADSHVMHMNTTVYFIADSSQFDVPSLWRKTNGDDAEELVPGVEDLQIEYGEDTDNDRTADTYDSANNVDMENVVSVHIALLMVSLEEVAPEPVPYRFNGNTYANPTDNHIRREFIATVNLRNRSP